ncbi:hypothetical protein COCOBI_18-1440 [Coccomyxa sp. Obi]|nr:hypothetical protein COCOBI_18-1440 [Coccomyxa sp. Obi]
MTASKSLLLLALFAVAMLGGSARASGSRALLQGSGVPDSYGQHDCATTIYGTNEGSVLAANCPHDGQRYSVCLDGPAVRGCRLYSQGPFPKVDCDAACWVEQL